MGTSSTYLSLMSSIFTAINTQKVHPVLYPITLGPALHAARVSMVYQSLARRSPTPLSTSQHIVGFLLMVCASDLVLCYWFTTSLLTGLGRWLTFELVPRTTCGYALLINYRFQLCVYPSGP